MIYIKLEENMDKFLEKQENLPKTMRKILFHSKIRNGKFRIEKENDLEYIILPCVNDKVLNRLKKLSVVRCWKNICLSDNLIENAKLLEFANQNNLKIVDGKWLFKNSILQILTYLVESKGESMQMQEISFLCNQLDETIVEEIKEISNKVKVLNILTDKNRQFQKLEEELYQTKGIIINVSSNYKKILMKSNIVVNFDFLPKNLSKCNFSKKTDFINILNNYKIEKKDFLGRNITNFEIVMPEKYLIEQEILDVFTNKNLYEGLIYKHTSYKNIQNEMTNDDYMIMYLEDCDKKIIKTSRLNFTKTLDKIPI